jgi:hypothetical protein
VLLIVLLNQTKRDVRWSDQIRLSRRIFTSCIWEGYILKQLRILYHKTRRGRGGGEIYIYIYINCGGFIHKAWNERLKKKSFVP